MSIVKIDTNHPQFLSRLYYRYNKSKIENKVLPYIMILSENVMGYNCRLFVQMYGDFILKYVHLDNLFIPRHILGMIEKKGFDQIEWYNFHQYYQCEYAEYLLNFSGFISTDFDIFFVRKYLGNLEEQFRLNNTNFKTRFNEYPIPMKPKYDYHRR